MCQSLSYRIHVTFILGLLCAAQGCSGQTGSPPTRPPLAAAHFPPTPAPASAPAAGHVEVPTVETSATAELVSMPAVEQAVLRENWQHVKKLLKSITRNMQTLTTFSQSYAASSEEAAATSDDLNTWATGFDGVVRRLAGLAGIQLDENTCKLE